MPDTHSIRHHFRQLEGPRVERSRIHSLHDILLISLCALLCGAESFVPVEDFGQAQHEWLSQLLELTGGGVALTAAKNEKRATLVALVRELASYVQVTCKGDLSVLLTSGFPHQKPERQPVGELPPPANLQVKLGARSGQLVTKAEPVPGASIYNGRVTQSSSPDNAVQTRQTTGARHTFTGLTPGVIYSVEVNAFGTAGPSNWAGTVRQMVV